MTVLDLQPRLDAAKRRQRKERLIAAAVPPGSADMLAAQLRLLVLPVLFGSLLLEEASRYFDAVLGYGQAGR